MSTPMGVEDPAIVVRLLSAIERDSGLTQRRLSQELGIALGLANTYLKRCVRKGLVKMGQVPMRRYAYYLTPKGFAEKSRLTAEYLTVSLDFFRRARRECTALLLHAHTACGVAPSCSARATWPRSRSSAPARPASRSSPSSTSGARAAPVPAGRSCAISAVLPAASTP